MKKIFLIYVIFISVLTADEASYNRGEMLFFSKGCSSCHGASAEGSTTYPRLANKDAAYLNKRFSYFKLGKAQSVSQQMMAQFIEKLKPQEIEDLISFLSNHKKPKKQEVDDELLGGFGS